jgi:NADH-quinone oxidoreductase subunit E
LTEKRLDFSVVDQILEKYPKDELSTIAILQDVQEHYNYLPREAWYEKDGSQSYGRRIS